MKGIITGRTEEGIIFIKTAPETAKELILDAEIEITVGVKVTATPIPTGRNFYGEDNCGEAKCVILTDEQIKFLNEMADVFGGSIPWEDMDEDSSEYIDTYNFTNL